MPRSRLPAVPRPGRRTPRELPSALPPPDPVPSARSLLLHSWAGRLFLGAAGVKAVVWMLRAVATVPAPVEIVSTAATLGLVLSVGYFTWRLFVLMKRRLLWRVRRKLILSYIFIGVIPALLIISFFTLGAWVVSVNVSAYLFREGYNDVVDAARRASADAALEIARRPAAAAEVVGRAHAYASLSYRALSIRFIPASRKTAPAQAGEWAHTSHPPEQVPDWANREFAGTVVAAPDDRREKEIDLVIRAVSRVESATGPLLGHVVVDIPVNAELLSGLHEVTGVKAGAVRFGSEVAAAIPQVAANQEDGRFALFNRGVVILETREWERGEYRRAMIANTYLLRDLYERLSAAQSVQVQGEQFGQSILVVLIVVAVLFLMIQFVALTMGLSLARSITSSIHELFMGTERVRHGDFTHRINIMSNDQLGKLAGSFNQMIGSIENLLQTAAEKKRLEEELRIARQIQMSLLPRGPVDVPGLAVTALCVPAREVGGDYYDFFRLPQDRLGVLIADVSGKGTSAALYMAELKGLVLSLSQIYLSPRQLLIEVNRIISENLDSRSFITMTYAVLDLNGGTMTYARAGHTPLIFLRSGGSGQPGVHVLAPSGMVLGLRIPGADEKFVELLEEDRLELGRGDVIVLYTDGITEAMNPSSDLFGEARLSRIVEEHGHLESGELRERILREIEAFVGTADQHDDMTMILLKVEQVLAARVAV